MSGNICKFMSKQQFFLSFFGPLILNRPRFELRTRSPATKPSAMINLFLNIIVRDSKTSSNAPTDKYKVKDEFFLL